MRNMMIGHKIIFILIGFVLCEPPEKISALNVHNRTENDLILYIENDPLYFGEPNYQEFYIESNEIITFNCFTHSQNPVDSYVDGILFGVTNAPTFGLRIDIEEVKEWNRPPSSSEISSHSPFNKRSWIYNSEKKPIDCDGVTDNGGNIQFNITSEDIGIEF